jgi:hypothetical protein
MDYLLAGLLVLILVAIGVTLLTISARRHGRERPRAAADQSYGAGVPGSDAAIVAADSQSPLGDTSEHAGGQRDGATVSGQDADRHGGSRRPVGRGYAATGRIGRREERPERDDAGTARPVVGGEGEGVRRISKDA